MSSHSISRPFVNLYKTLSVSPTATTAQIKSAFFKLAKSCHPDVNTSSDSESTFKRINDAYQTLIKDRTEYDIEYAAHHGSPATRPGVPFTRDSGFSRSATPWDPSPNSTTDFQWGKAWASPPRERQAPRHPKREEQQSDSSHTTARSPKQQKKFDKEKSFDERFFWFENNADFAKSWGSNNQYESMGHKKHYNKHRQRQGPVWDEGGIDFEEEEEDEYYSLYESDTDERHEDRHRGNTRQRHETDEALHYYRMKHRNHHKDNHGSDFYRPWKVDSTKTRSRLTQKILQRIREDPRPSDIDLLKKFGLDPQQFGFGGGNEKSTDKNVNADDKSRKEAANGTSQQHDVQKSRQRKQQTRANDAAAKENLEIDLKENDLEESDLEDSDLEESDYEDGDLVYDFSDDSFRWKTKRKVTSKRTNADTESETIIKNSSTANEGENISTRESNTDSKHSKSVSVFTLASKRFKSQNDLPQPLMKPHRGNRIEGEFFLTKKHVLDW